MSTEPIHDFFGLTYASYLVLPRTVLQSCSQETQHALVDALERVAKEEAEHTGKHWPGDASVTVLLKDEATGRFVKDDLADYQRGRRKLWDDRPCPPR